MYILQIYDTIGRDKYFKLTKRTGEFNEPAVTTEAILDAAKLKLNAVILTEI